MNISDISARVSAPLGKRLTLVCLALYTVVRLPLLVQPLGGWYHAMHQFTAVNTAVETARRGVLAAMLGFGPSGANLNGVLGAPVVTLGLDLRLIRIISFVAGLAILFTVANIVRWYGGSRRTAALSVVFLIVTPFFVILTSLTLPEPVTMAFGVASLYTYLLYRSNDERLFWAVASGTFGGLAALNHLWGGIATLTVASYELIVLAVLTRRGERARVRTLVERRLPLGIAHVVGLIPMALVFEYYQKIGVLGSIYGKTTILESWNLLVTFDWWTTMGAYVFEYQPLMFVSVLLLGVLGWLVLTRGLSVLVIEREGELVVSPLAFWSVWLVGGGMIPIFFPFGAYVHEYYFWWSIVPAVGLFAWWISERSTGSWRPFAERGVDRGTLRVLLVIVLLLGTASIMSLQVSRSYVGPQEEGVLASGPPVVCWFQRCIEPRSHEHKRAVAAEFSEFYDYGSRDVVAFTLDRHTRKLRIYMHLSAREVEKFEDVEDYKQKRFNPRLSYVVTAKPFPEAELNLRLLRTVRAAGDTTYIYATGGGG